MPEGFRDRMTARQHPRACGCCGSSATAPNCCRPPTIRRCRSPASRRTISPTLAGWWRGADIGERLMLGLLTPRPRRARRSRRGARRSAALSRRCSRPGCIASAPAEDAPLDDAIAAAVHALIGGAGSVLASAQFDDLVGETVATNLPGTDRERPNWRLKAERRRRRRLRRRPRAGDPRGAGQGADIDRPRLLTGRAPRTKRRRRRPCRNRPPCPCALSISKP